MCSELAPDANVTGMSLEGPAGLRDPEDRPVPHDPSAIREKMLDKTNADSFPTSDPHSSIPDPSADDSFAIGETARIERQLDERAQKVA